MKQSILIFILTAMVFPATAQSFAINTDGSTANTSALLDVKSTNKGVLVPRMNKTEKNAIATPATGLLVFQNGPDSLGFHYYNGSSWVWLANTTGTGWLTTGNSGTDTSVNFIGTTDAMPLRFKQNNQWLGQFNSNNRTYFIGKDAGKNNTTGLNNIGIGDSALFFNKTTNQNTAIGNRALRNYRGPGFTNFTNNTAIGYAAMEEDTSGFSNTAVGTQSFRFNQKGDQNTGIGAFSGTYQKGERNFFGGTFAGMGNRSLFAYIVADTGNFNTGLGNASMASLANGNNNTAVGYASMFYDSSGSNNTAVGSEAAENLVTAENCVAVGYRALHFNNRNNITALGTYAGQNNASFTSVLTYGIENTMIGYAAMNANRLGSKNTAVGHKAMTIFEPETGFTANESPSRNVAVGDSALYSNRGDDQVAIGFKALRGSNSNTQNQSVAVGSYALEKAVATYPNTAVGHVSMQNALFAAANTAMGSYSLTNLISGINNTAVGNAAMYEVISPSGSVNNNTAVGSDALRKTRYAGNTAVGSSALREDTSGINNTAVGYLSLATNFSGASNTSVGAFAGNSNTTGARNTYVGNDAGRTATTAVNNTYVGEDAGHYASGSSNTFIGQSAGFGNALLPTSGSNNTLLGFSTSVSTTISNATGIGYNANVTQSNSMVLGDVNVTKWGFGTNATAPNILEFVNTTARLTTGGVWTNASDRNLKTNIQLVNGKDILNRIMQLPISRWNYKNQNSTTTHIGPMAQDFYKLFNTGGDDKTISSIDPSGVALAGIQQLKIEIEELKKIILQQQQTIQSLIKSKK